MYTSHIQEEGLDSEFRGELVGLFEGYFKFADIKYCETMSEHHPNTKSPKSGREFAIILTESSVLFECQFFL